MPTGPVEVARHHRSSPGRPSINDEHYPPRHPDGERTPRATTAEEAAFLALGPGAAAWLVEAAAAGTRRIRSKMAEALTLAKLHGPTAVDQALGAAATYGRFADGDLLAILTHQRHGPTAPPIRASETHSLQPGTAAWAHIGQRTNPQHSTGQCIEEGDG